MDDNKKFALSTALAVMTTVVFVLSLTGAKISKGIRLLAFAVEIILAVMLFRDSRGKKEEIDDFDYDDELDEDFDSCVVAE